MQVIAGPNSQLLAHRLSEELGSALVTVDADRFPDGEQELRIEGGLGDEVAVVQSTRTDGDLVALLLMLDAASREASEVTAVVPYLGYSRQDRVFEEGEPLSLQAVVRAVNAQGSEILTVEPHSDPSGFGDISPVSSIPVMRELVAGWGPDVVLAPDEGASEEAAAVADAVGAESDFLVKERLSGEEISMSPKNLFVEGLDIVILDDIISTGGTMSRAASMLTEQGAGSVNAAATHGVFARNAVSRLLSSGLDRLAVTDTLETAMSEASVAPVLADALR